MGIFSFARRASKSATVSSTPPAPLQTLTSNRLAKVDWSEQARLSAQTGALYQADYYFFIDIVGSCNLTCPSCPVGNLHGTRPKGLMSISTYNAILQKIATEHEGQSVFIDLYNWGESPIHPELPKFVTATRAAGYGCGISTNLNTVADMRGLVKAEPSYIRISLSGASNAIYQQTHRGGDIFQVKGNMYHLRAMLDRYEKDIPIQVGFHVYNHNAGSEYDQMAELCDELGFLFLPAVGILQPLEKVISSISGGVAENDRAVVDLMVLKPNEWKELLQSERDLHGDCIHRRARTTINYDGSVPLCCAVYASENTISSSFLDTPRSELERRKYAAKTCATCFSHNMDMMITGVRSPEINGVLLERSSELRAAEGLSMDHFRL